jgi:hypothetical protein
LEQFNPGLDFAQKAAAILEGLGQPLIHHQAAHGGKLQGRVAQAGVGRQLAEIMQVVLAFSRCVVRDETGKRLFGAVAEMVIEIGAEPSGFGRHPGSGLFPDLPGCILGKRLSHLEGLGLDFAGRANRV